MSWSDFSAYLEFQSSDHIDVRYPDLSWYFRAQEDHEQSLYTDIAWSNLSDDIEPRSHGPIYVPDPCPDCHTQEDREQSVYTDIAWSDFSDGVEDREQSVYTDASWSDFSDDIEPQSHGSIDVPDTCPDCHTQEDHEQSNLYSIKNGVMCVDEGVVGALARLRRTFPTGCPGAGMFQGLSILDDILDINPEQFAMSVGGTDLPVPECVFLGEGDPIIKLDEHVSLLRRRVLELVGYSHKLKIVDGDGKQSFQVVSEFIKGLHAMRGRLDLISKSIIEDVTPVLSISPFYLGTSSDTSVPLVKVSDYDWYFRRQRVYLQMRAEVGLSVHEYIGDAREHARKAEAHKADITTGRCPVSVQESFESLMLYLCRATFNADKARGVQRSENA